MRICSRSLASRLEKRLSRSRTSGQVVQTRATHRSIVQSKASNSNDVQRYAGGRTQARNVSGVRRNFRLN